MEKSSPMKTLNSSTKDQCISVWPMQVCCCLLVLVVVISMLVLFADILTDLPFSKRAQVPTLTGKLLIFRSSTFFSEPRTDLLICRYCLRCISISQTCSLLTHHDSVLSDETLFVECAPCQTSALTDLNSSLPLLRYVFQENSKCLRN